MLKIKTKPTLKEEKILWKKGYEFVVGLDEAGRGPLAGPVVAGAVNFKFEIFNFKSSSNFKFLKEINDSKKLNEKKREQLYKVITTHPDIKWGIGIVSEKVIDKINILEATKKAMLMAIKNLRADYLLIDGNFKINCEAPQKSIIKGDQKVFSIAASSIIAKVTRDRIMQKMHKKYPAYGFDKHKGYGTKVHIKAIKKHGHCLIHRKSFAPLANF